MSYLPHIYHRNQPKVSKYTQYTIHSMNVSLYLPTLIPSKSTIHVGRYIPVQWIRHGYKFLITWTPKAYRGRRTHQCIFSTSSGHQGAFFDVFFGGWLFFFVYLFMISPTRKARHLESFFGNHIPHFLKI